MEEIRSWWNSKLKGDKIMIIIYSIIVILFIFVCIYGIANSNDFWGKNSSIYDGYYCVTCGSKSVGTYAGKHYCAKHMPH